MRWSKKHLEEVDPLTLAIYAVTCKRFQTRSSLLKERLSDVHNLLQNLRNRIPDDAKSNEEICESLYQSFHKERFLTKD
jgi:hypothetical protein